MTKNAYVQAVLDGVSPFMRKVGVLKVLNVRFGKDKRKEKNDPNDAMVSRMSSLSKTCPQS